MNTQPETNVSQPPPSDQSESSFSSALPYFLCLTVVLAAMYGGWTVWRVRHFEAAGRNAIPLDVIGPALTEFELTERSGKPFRSADMKGRVWVATYFFTTCPGECLRLNTNIKLLSDEPDLKDVTWVSISCDPDNDTVEALRAYADRFQADQQRWLFCRGDLSYVQRVAKGMKLFLSLKGHQQYAIVIDKTGKIRGMFDATSQIETGRLRDLLLKCLAEKPPHDLVNASAPKEKSS